MFIYERHKKIRRRSPKELEIGGTIYCCFFFKKINSDEYCHDCQHHFHYYLLYLELFLYLRVSVFLLHMTVFLTQCPRGKSMYCPFVNNYLTKTWFLIDITNSFKNFIWFALLSHQKSDNRPLFKPEVFFKLLPFWISWKQISCKIEIIFGNVGHRGDINRCWYLVTSGRRTPEGEEGRSQVIGWDPKTEVGTPSPQRK